MSDTRQTVNIGQRVYSFRGVSDEVSECDCCGRKGLKRTVVMEPTDGGEVVFFGTTCAAKAAGWRTVEIQRAAESAERAAVHAKRDAWQARYAAHPAIVALRAEREAFRASHGGLLFGFGMERIQASNAIVAAVEAEIGPCP